MGSELPRTGAASDLGLSGRRRRKREGHDESAGSLDRRWRRRRDGPAFGVPALDPSLACEGAAEKETRRPLPGDDMAPRPRERCPVILKLQYRQTGDLVPISPMINR